jgi:hypothetical protein
MLQLKFRILKKISQLNIYLSNYMVNYTSYSFIKYRLRQCTQCQENDRTRYEKIQKFNVQSPVDTSTSQSCRARNGYNLHVY